FPKLCLKCAHRQGPPSLPVSLCGGSGAAAPSRAMAPGGGIKLRPRRLSLCLAHPRRRDAPAEGRLGLAAQVVPLHLQLPARVRLLLHIPHSPGEPVACLLLTPLAVIGHRQETLLPIIRQPVGLANGISQQLHRLLVFSGTILSCPVDLAMTWN